LRSNFGTPVVVVPLVTLEVVVGVTVVVVPPDVFEVVAETLVLLVLVTTTKTYFINLSKNICCAVSLSYHISESLTQDTCCIRVTNTWKFLVVYVY